MILILKFHDFSGEKVDENMIFYFDKLILVSVMMKTLQRRANISIKQLVYFKTISECCHFTKAAFKLNCAQSNLSSAIKLLEEELNLHLFERHRKSIKLSYYGRELIPFVRDSLNAMDEIKNIASQLNGHNIKLRLGTMEAAASTILSKCLPEFQYRYPNINLHLKTAIKSLLIQGLYRKEIDIAIFDQEIQDDRFMSFPVFHTEMVLITASPDNFSKINEQTLLTFQPGSAYRELSEKIIKSQNKEKIRVLSYASYETIISCVAANMGFSIIPKAIVEKNQLSPNISFCLLPEEYRTSKNYLVCLKSIYRMQRNSIDDLLTILKQY